MVIKLFVTLRDFFKNGLNAPVVEDNIELDINELDRIVCKFIAIFFRFISILFSLMGLLSFSSSKFKLEVDEEADDIEEKDDDDDEWNGGLFGDGESLIFFKRFEVASDWRKLDLNNR